MACYFCNNIEGTKIYIDLQGTELLKEVMDKEGMYIDDNIQKTKKVIFR